MTLYPQGPRPPRKEKRARKPLRRSSEPVKRRRPKGPTAKRRAERRAKIERADADWSSTVRSRDGWCRLNALLGCKSMATDAHHVKGKKAYPRLRYDLDNGLALCRRAHDWAHANRKTFRAWFIQVYVERWARLEAKAARESRLA